MIRRSIFASLAFALFALPLAGAAGCAAPTDGAAEDPVAGSEDALSATKTLAGSWFTHKAMAGGFGRLDLETNGKYTAQIVPAGPVACVTSPCFVPEKGTWSAKKSGASYSLTVHPSGGKPARTYSVDHHAHSLDVSLGGASETLFALTAGECLDDGDCGAGDVCQPRACLMYCAFDDFQCCGPSTCTPKTPPPPPPTCGSVTCPAGEVCCNPLASICAKPGEFCIM